MSTPMKIKSVLFSSIMFFIFFCVNFCLWNLEIIVLIFNLFL
jgi:hypothetical protein